MAKILDTISLSYGDVTLIGQPGKIESRKNIPVEMNKVVVAGMTSIICKPFIKAVSLLPKEYQPTLHIPRDNYFEENLRYSRECNLENIFVGTNLDYNSKYVELAKELGYNNILIDVAWGGLPQLSTTIPMLKNKGFNILCGSVHTKELVDYLANCGVDIIRLGIGTSSSICSTRYTTGFFRGSITETMECAPQAKKYSKKVMVDGGLIFSGDYVKAFLAGADYAMGGRYFTQATEARLHVEGTKEYYGMSNPVKGISNSGFDESFSTKIEDESKPLEILVKELWEGIASGVSYSGYSTLSNAIGNGVFEKLAKRHEKYNLD